MSTLSAAAIAKSSSRHTAHHSASKIDGRRNPELKAAFAMLGVAAVCVFVDDDGDVAFAAARDAAQELARWRSVSKAGVHLGATLYVPGPEVRGAVIDEAAKQLALRPGCRPFRQGGRWFRGVSVAQAVNSLRDAGALRGVQVMDSAEVLNKVAGQMRRQVEG